VKDHDGYSHRTSTAIYSNAQRRETGANRYCTGWAWLYIDISHKPFIHMGQAIRTLY
jgi:hypothetical protein